MRSTARRQEHHETPSLGASKFQQFGQITAENHLLLSVGNLCLQDVVDRVGPVVDRNVRSVHHLGRAGLRHQMPYVLGRKDHRVDEQLVPEVFRWSFLVEAIGAGADITGDVGTAEVRRQIAASVRADDS